MTIVRMRSRRTGVDLRALAMPLKKRSKYGNKPTVIDGARFDSQAEAKRWDELRLLEKAGEISQLRRQPTFKLARSVKFSDEKRAKPALRYVGDFYYVQRSGPVVEDFKSPATVKTAAFRIKRHLMLAIFGIEVRIVMTGSGYRVAA